MELTVLILAAIAAASHHAPPHGERD